MIASVYIPSLSFPELYVVELDVELDPPRSLVATKEVVFTGRDSRQGFGSLTPIKLEAKYVTFS